MTIYKEIGRFSPSKEVKTETDILVAIKELSESYIWLNVEKEKYSIALRKALKEKKDVIELETLGFIETVDISPLTQAMKNYECIRNNPDFSEAVLGPNPRPLEKILAEV